MPCSSRSGDCPTPCWQAAAEVNLTEMTDEALLRLVALDLSAAMKD